MKNTMITLKKNSGSQVGMKMKATLKRGQKKKKKASQYPTAFPSPAQKSQWTQEPALYLNVHFRQDDAQYELSFHCGSCPVARGSGFAQPNLRLLEWSFLYLP